MSGPINFFPQATDLESYVSFCSRKFVLPTGETGYKKNTYLGTVGGTDLAKRLSKEILTLPNLDLDDFFPKSTCLIHLPPDLPIIYKTN